MPFDQSAYDLRCEWGEPGLTALAPASDAVVIVDVLSFSTAVDVAVGNGATVLPYPWKDSARDFATSKGALLAGSRSAQAEFTLSPCSLRTIPRHTALVLPSPNGSALSLKAGQTATFTACLRNAPAVAARIRETASRVAVIPAGECWPDGTLRPSLEDWIGAGALLAELPGIRSPEAELAVTAFERFRSRLHEALSGCGSGRELIARGFAEDIDLAADYDASESVPFFIQDRFVDRRPVTLG